jgi:hypothetical protein
VIERKLYGVESSSTFLECIPKSLQARVTWTFQKNPQQTREEVSRDGRGLGRGFKRHSWTVLLRCLSMYYHHHVFVV